MKIKLLALFIFVSFYNVAFADSIVERKVSPRRSAIQSTNVVFSQTAQKPVYNSYNSAIAELQTKIEKTPNDYLLYVGLIDLYLKSKQFDKAYEELVFLNNLAQKNKLSSDVLNEIEKLKNSLTKSVRYERNFFGVYTNLAMMNLILQNSQEAEQCIVSASKNISNSQMFNDAFKRIFDTTGNYTGAVNTLDKILQLMPSQTDLRKLKADYLLQTNKSKEAIAEMVQVLALNSKDDETRLSLYKILRNQNLQEKDLMKKLYPNQTVDYEKAYTELANLLLNDNDVQGAKEYAVLLAKKYPENANGFILLSEIYRKEGDLKASYEALKLVRDKVDSAEAVSKYNVLLAKLSDEPVKEADSLMNTGLYAQALSVLQSANPESLYVILGMARANYFLNNKQTALELLNKAMSLYPNNADVFYYFAFIFYKEGDIESSRNYLAQALKINPEHQYSLQLVDVLNKVEADKYTNQIISAFEVQNYNEAMRLIKEALKINKKDSALYYYQGLTYIAMNNYAAATAPLYKAIELDKNNTMAYFYLGLTFDNLSEPNNALNYYKKFITLLPADDYGESEKLNYAKTRIEKLSK